MMMMIYKQDKVTNICIHGTLKIAMQRLQIYEKVRTLRHKAWFQIYSYIPLSQLTKGSKLLSSDETWRRRKVGFFYYLNLLILFGTLSTFWNDQNFINWFLFMSRELLLLLLLTLLLFMSRELEVIPDLVMSGALQYIDHLHVDWTR